MTLSWLIFITIYALIAASVATVGMAEKDEPPWVVYSVSLAWLPMLIIALIMDLLEI